MSRRLLKKRTSVQLAPPTFADFTEHTPAQIICAIQPAIFKRAIVT